MRVDANELQRFFRPKSVAVVGASVKEGTVGRALIENLIERFRGRIYPVNIKYDEVLGLKCFKSCRDLPEPPDLVVVAVPARVVPKVIDECGSIGSRAAVVISAGFREIGGEGAKLEEAVVKMARKHGMRVIGPNCLGIYSPSVGLDTIFNPSDRQGKPDAGPVAFISQSGALGAAVLDWFTEAGLGMSKFVSYGNAADVKEYELIEFLADDEETKVITAYLEGVEDGRKFSESLRYAAGRGKPVIILKAGKSVKGAKAVSSHTGSMAGSYRVYESAIKQFGGLLVDELSELVIAAKALSWLPTPRGDRVAIVTNGGGAGVLATDAVEKYGMRMAELTDDTQKALRNELPSAAAVGNPVDVLGDAPPERYRKALKWVIKDPNVDALVVIGIMQSPAFDPEGFIEVLREASSGVSKPVVIAAPGGEYTSDKISKIEKLLHLPAFKTPEEAVRALSYLMRWRKVVERFGKG
ncbi:MAG: CoA-binding protein [Desulfurococcales archaeon]|nr:CoA-binding protein [Desulfurococcales archaeon]